jgi:hypothetical protein
MMDKTAVCGLRCLEIERDGAELAETRTRQSVAAKGRSQLCETAARRKRVCLALHERCTRWWCLGILTTVQMYTIQKVAISS